MLDAAIAISFGAAYWQASDQKLFTCYALLAVVGALIVAYHFTPNRRVLWAILPHSVLTILFVALAWLARIPRLAKRIPDRRTIVATGDATGAQP